MCIRDRLFWDVMNEPSWHGFILSVDDPEERQRRLDMVWDFVRHFIRFVREKDPVNALGVGPVSYTHLDVYKRQMLLYAE